MNNNSLKWVSEDTIRQIFNQKYLEKIENGDYKMETKRDSHLTNPPEEVPFCTRSQIIKYFDPNFPSKYKLIAVVHRFLCPDGSIGASGKPDPKEIRFCKEGQIIKCCVKQTE